MSNPLNLSKVNSSSLAQRRRSSVSLMELRALNAMRESRVIVSNSAEVAKSSQDWRKAGRSRMPPVCRCSKNWDRLWKRGYRCAKHWRNAATQLRSAPYMGVAASTFAFIAARSPVSRYWKK